MSHVSMHSAEVTANVYTEAFQAETTDFYEQNFEATGGGTAGWTGSGATRRNAAAEARTGTYYIRFDQAGVLSRTFTGLIIGASYTFSFWARTDGGNSTLIAFQDAAEGITYTKIGFGLDDTYRFFSFTFTARASTETLSISPNGLTGLLRVDDMWMTQTRQIPVPVRLSIPATNVLLAMDETYAMSIQATVTAPLPTRAELALLDPRNRVQVRVVLSEKFGVSEPASAVSAVFAGLPASAFSAAWLDASAFSAAHYDAYTGSEVIPPVHAALNLILRSRSTDLAGGTITYILTSEEGLLHDYALVAAREAYPAGALVSDAVRFVLRKVDAHLGTPEADAPVEEYDSLAWMPGVTAWDYLQPILQATGLRLWCDADRQWRLTGAVHNTANSITLTADHITTVSDDISRDELWWDSVVIVYRWTDADGVQQTRYDTASVDGQHTRTYTHQYNNVRYPGPGAAQEILDRAMNRGRNVSVTAVSDYTIRPGQVVVIQLPDTAELTGRVESVEWALPDGEMTLTTREITEAEEGA